MKYWRLLGISVVVTIVVFSLAWGALGAGTPIPGSSEDPLVSKSYVDAYIEEYVKAFLQNQGGNEAGLTVVQVEAGQALIGEAGTEIVLRAGSATIIDSELGGIMDATGGTDLRQGALVPQNHLLIIPRSDGRGVEVSSDAVFMVRGAYTIK